MADKNNKEPEKKEKQEVKETKPKKGMEINAEIREKEQKLFDLRIDLRLGKLQNTNEIKAVRREIAKLKTKENLDKFIASSKE